MIVIFILLILVITVGVIMFINGYDWAEKFLGLLFGLFIGGVLAVGVAVILGIVGQVVNTTKTVSHYSQKIVSLQDGSQVQGSMSGGLFLVRGQIGETQYFSYYRQTGENTFNLDKRETGASNIITDATAETARVDITDEISVCRSTWWSICDEKPTGISVHADFHVPANSVKNDFELDAQ
jgi:hypothetical protein